MKIMIKHLRFQTCSLIRSANTRHTVNRMPNIFWHRKYLILSSFFSTISRMYFCFMTFVLPAYIDKLFFSKNIGNSAQICQWQNSLLALATLGDKTQIEPFQLCVLSPNVSTVCTAQGIIYFELQPLLLSRA